MKEIKLSARIRTESGKKTAYRLRKKGFIPGTLYGHKQEPLNIEMSEHELWTILHHATTEHLIISLDIEGGENDTVLTLVKDVQHHPVSGDILHIDLQRISSNETIKVGIPVILTGTAKGVKEFGGILDHGIREVLIMTTPASIPEAVEVDIANLLIGQSIHISDIIEKYPDLDFIEDANVTIAHVAPPKKLELTEAEVEAAEAAAEVEQEGEEAGEAAEGEE